jgi:uncharacterized protein YjbI with pentapeptide repeats
LEQIIVCFFADGSEKYTQMTVMAISSFLEKTPYIKVGLLTHDAGVRDRVLEKLNPIHQHRVAWRQTSDTPHLVNWNPTQYKLDIAKFADDGFECIFWMDSDTVTYGDMTQFLLRFSESNKQFFLVKDHVMFNSDFVANWTRERPLGIIPQACFMGFKYSIIKPFFSLWRQFWEQWITPMPFTNYPDPNPNFVGSMFCIEQYALAMALARFLGDYNLGDDAVMLFDRELMLLQHDGRMTLDIVNKISTVSGGISGLQLSGLNISGLNLSGLNLLFSGLNISGINLSGLNVSGINISGLQSGINFNTSGINFSGLNISGLVGATNISGINVSGINVSGGFNVSGASGLNLLAYALSSGLSGLNLSGLNTSSINISGLSTEELLARLNISGLNMSGLNASGLNLSGLTLGQLEHMLGGATVDLSGIDYKYLQGTPDVSSPFHPQLALVDKFGNSFIHYYNQNFEAMKEGFQ